MGIVPYYMPHLGDGSGYLNPVRRTDIRDTPRSGRPASATSESDVAAVKSAVEQDARCTVEKISHLCSTNSSSVFHIMTNVVKLRKVCARWLPHLLTADQEGCACESRQSCSICTIMLTRNPWMKSWLVMKPAFIFICQRVRNKTKVWIGENAGRP